MSRQAPGAIPRRAAAGARGPCSVLAPQPGGAGPQPTTPGCRHAPLSWLVGRPPKQPSTLCLAATATAVIHQMRQNAAVVAVGGREKWCRYATPAVTIV